MSVTPLASAGPRLVASDSKTTVPPPDATVAVRLGPLAPPRRAATVTSIVDAVCVSRVKMSETAPLGSAVRLEAVDSKTTRRPFEERSGRPLAPLAIATAAARRRRGRRGRRRRRRRMRGRRRERAGRMAGSEACGAAAYVSAAPARAACHRKFPVAARVADPVPRVILRAAALAAACLLTAAVPAVAQDELKPENPVGPVSYHGWKFTTLDKDAPEPQTSPAPYGGEAVVAQSYYVGREAAEPTLGVDRDGSVFYAASAFDALGTGALAHTQILRSDDGGLTWNNTTFAAGGIDIPPTTLDPYTYVDRKTSRVFSIDLAGAGSFLVYSDDKGQTWNTSAMSSPGVNDHQTFFTGPPPKKQPARDHAGHLPQRRLLLRQPALGLGLLVLASTAATRSGRCSRRRSSPAASCHGHGVVDSEGRVFLPARQRARRRSRSPRTPATPGTSSTVAGEPTTSEPHTAVAVDAADNVYYVWYDGRAQAALPVGLARSRR